MQIENPRTKQTIEFDTMQLPDGVQSLSDWLHQPMATLAERKETARRAEYAANGVRVKRAKTVKRWKPAKVRPR